MHEIVFFYPENHERHASPDHPERPERVVLLREKLVQADLWKPERVVGPAVVERAVLGAIHTSAHIAGLEKTAQQPGMLDGDTYITPYSWQAALNAAGGAIAVAEQVFSGAARRGFALTRPPGHHATPETSMGFCLLNNIALAAEQLLQSHGASRIAIIDIDVHHGNGTQDIFYNRPEVFFCSIHQYPLFPMTGLAKETGAGAGKGTNLNIPFPPYAGDAARQAVLDRVLLPLLEDFRPEIILVSAGFDAHWRDPLGHQVATVDGYASLIAQLAAFADRVCQGRIALFLEGGYDLEAGAAGGVAVSQALIGKDWNDRLGRSSAPEDSYWETRLNQVLKVWDRV
ncbi:histone deacetylase [bacterium]|nr:histone deacetylase [bacterium]MCB2179246.1 histone deacetylase [bacterium]